MTKRKYDYPAPQARESGSKVSWHFYASEADATAASAIARDEAIEVAAMGYDFGLCSPGSIDQPQATGKHAGLYRVCLP